MDMTRWIAGFALALAISACGSEVPRSWVSTVPRTDARSDLWRDWYVCNRENTRGHVSAVGGVVSTDYYADDNLVASCLRAHGWRPYR